MKNNNINRKRVIVRNPYDSDGSRYLMTDDQITALRKMQEDGFIDEDIEITVIDEEGPWELV
jgi:hypothetical protein